MDAQKQLQQKLLYALQERRLKNPKYSMTAFAKKIGVRSSALSEILNGKRKVSPKMAEKLLTGAGVAKVEIDKVTMSF